MLRQPLFKNKRGNYCPLTGQQGDYDKLAPETLYSYRFHLVSHSMTHYLMSHFSRPFPRARSQLVLNNVSPFAGVGVIFWASLTKRQHKN